MSYFASKAQVHDRRRKLVRNLVACLALIGLIAACNLQPPGASTTLPDTSTPESTTPAETTTPTTTPTTAAPTTTPETSPETTVPAGTTVPGATTTVPAETEGTPSPWLWFVLAAVAIALLVAMLMRRNKEGAVVASWTERTRTALAGLVSIEATLGRPATLDPADHEAMRRSIASARDQSVTFEQLAASASDPAAAQHASATADALRVLATSTEIEVQGLAAGTLNTAETRAAAESERMGHVQALRQAAERLTQSLQ